LLAVLVVVEIELVAAVLAGIVPQLLANLLAAVRLLNLLFLLLLALLTQSQLGLVELVVLMVLWLALVDLTQFLRQLHL
jgi:hypothetical protein